MDLLETAHATAHDFIGGDMADLESASNEPVFYMLHCFIDLIYEVWRQQKDVTSSDKNIFKKLIF